MSRHPRALLAVVLATLVLPAVAAAPASSPTTVATDACGDPVDDDVAPTTPWTDLCELSLRSTQLPVEGSNDTVTSLEVRVRMASTDRRTASMTTVRWDVDGCSVRLAFGDETDDRPAISALGRECATDDVDGDCLVTVDEFPDGGLGMLCFEGYPYMDIGQPRVEGDTYVWEIVFEGALAELVGDHAAGTVLDVRQSTSSQRTHEARAAEVFPVCAVRGGRMTWCVGAADMMDATADFTIR